ncbi:hypothetical protein GW17_00040739 [Ensete ventricosum]|nr:hypothetical protein GW17_00040739 [Ensete ventricosum]
MVGGLPRPSGSSEMEPLHRLRWTTKLMLGDAGGVPTPVKVLVIPIPFQDREGGDRLSSSFQGKLVGSDGDIFVVYYNTDWKSTAATAEGFQGEEMGTVASRSECEQLGRSYLIHRWLPGRGVSVSEMKPALESELQKADCIYYRRHIKDNLRRYCMQTGRTIEVAGLNMATDLVGWFTPETRTGGV